MNHRPIFASLDFPRKLMPGNYHYKNWNLASVKGFLAVNDHELLAFGNTGIWKTDRDFSRFEDFNAGFPKGIDHRKIFTMANTTGGRLFAGTLFGLYEYDKGLSLWKQVPLPEESPRVVKVLEKDNGLLILTRSELYKLNLNGSNSVSHIKVPAIAGHEGKAGLFRTLWVIHSGEIFGLAGKLVVDLVGLAVIFMTLTGFFYTFLPSFAKKIREGTRKKLQKLNRTTINWHTLIGVYGIPVLLITTITGMFLRPPLLIPIASAEVKAIPGTILASENVWEDKLRDMIYDTTANHLILSTSEGFYTLDLQSAEPATLPAKGMQPPVSVMGINVFEDLGQGNYLVASFSGIYKWNPGMGLVTDMITGQPITSYSQGNPFGAIAVAGIYMNNNRPVALLDYGSGWINMESHKTPGMPEQIANQPISWWNLALEIHTGRIFEFILGMFYIIYVPLMGILVLLILVTGFLMYWKSNKRKKKKLKDGNTKSTHSSKSTVLP